MTERSEGAVGLTAGLAVRRFPVLKPPPGCTAWVRWDALDAKWARHIHGQTLERLAERGGLCPEEIMLNLKRLSWSAKISREDAVALTNSIAANDGGNARHDHD